MHTLVLAEVVLIYLNPEESDFIIQWFAKNLKIESPLAATPSPSHPGNKFGDKVGYHCFLTFEQQKQEQSSSLSTSQQDGNSFPSSSTVLHHNNIDPFSQMMIQNLHEYGILLKSLDVYPNMTSQMERYKNLGWSSSEYPIQTITMKEAFEALISSEEKARISKLELLDELEEWNLLCSHYYFLLASL